MTIAVVEDLLPSERTLLSEHWVATHLTVMRVHVGLDIAVAMDAAVQDFCIHAVLARHADHVAAGPRRMSRGSVAGGWQRGRSLTWSQVRDAGPTAGGMCRPAGVLAHHACCSHGGDLSSSNGTEAVYVTKKQATGTASKTIGISRVFQSQRQQQMTRL